MNMMSNTQSIQTNLSESSITSTGTQEMHVSDWGELESYINLIRKRWLLIVFCALIGLVASVIITSKQDRIYTSRASVAVTSPQLRNIGDIQIQMPVYQIQQSYINTQIALLKSRKFGNKILSNLGDQVCQDFFGKDRKMVSVGELLRTIEARHREDTNIIYIYCEGKSPEGCAHIAGEFARGFIRENSRSSENQILQVMNWLKKEEKDLENKLIENREKLFSFEGDNRNLLFLGGSEEQRYEMFHRLRRELQNIQIQLIKMKIDYEKVKDVEKQDPSQYSMDFLDDSSIISALRARKIKLEDEYGALTLKYTTDHPQVKWFRDNIDKIDKEINKEIEFLIEQKKLAYLNVVDSEKKLSLMLADEKKRNLDIRRRYLEYDQLRQERILLVERHANFIKNLEKISSNANLQMDNIQMIDEPGIPSEPSKPKPLQNYIVGLIIGTALGGCIMLLLELFDERIKNPNEIFQILPTKLIGTIPYISNRVFRKAARAVEEKESVISEAFRSISTDLLLDKDNKDIILITSSLTQDGKTTIACNLAFSVAKSGNKVLLIDADMRKPQIAKQLELEKAPGLSEILTDGLPYNDVIQSLDKNLDIVVAGSSPKDAYQLIYNSDLKAILREAKKHYDFIIVDAPPLGMSNDGFLLSKLVKGVVFVASISNTHPKILRRISQRVQELEIPVLGLVLNDPMGDRVAQRVYSNYYPRYYYRYSYKSY